MLAILLVTFYDFYYMYQLTGLIKLQRTLVKSSYINVGYIKEWHPLFTIFIQWQVRLLFDMLGFHCRMQVILISVYIFQKTPPRKEWKLRWPSFNFIALSSKIQWIYIYEKIGSKPFLKLNTINKMLKKCLHF